MTDSSLTDEGYPPFMMMILDLTADHLLLATGHPILWDQGQSCVPVDLVMN